MLEQFDLIFCSEYYTAEKLREVLKNPDVIYLPPGVDTLGFAPVVEPSLRPIDVTNLGAIAEATHEGLLEYARESEGFYFFETLKGPFDAHSPSEHRFRYASILKRSKYFLCYFAKMRSPELPDQLELGSALHRRSCGWLCTPRVVEFDACIRNLSWLGRRRDRNAL